MNNRKRETLNALLCQGWLPIFVHDNYDSKVLVEAAVAAGCRCLEYTIRRHDAAKMIPWIKKEYPEAKVLVATLVDGPRAEAHLAETAPNFLSVQQAVDLGCDGLISYLGFRAETYAKFGDDLVIIPAVATPQEALNQFELGATMIKIADPDKSPIIVKVMRNNTHRLFGILVTGGMRVEVIPDYVEAGALVCAGGFDLYWPELGQDAPPEQIAVKVREHLDAVAAARKRYMPDLAEAIADGQTNLLDVIAAAKASLSPSCPNIHPYTRKVRCGFNNGEAIG